MTSELQPLTEYERDSLTSWYRHRKSRTKRLLPPPWAIARPFEDPDDPAVRASVAALHVFRDQPWLVRGTLRAAEEGPLTLAHIGVEHLFDPGVEVTNEVLRHVPAATIRDRANAWLRNHDVGLDALAIVGRVTPAERRWAQRAAAEAAKAPLRRGRQGYPADHFRGIALRAVELFEVEGRRDVIQALADERDKPYQTVRDWVRRARAPEYGFLNPVTQGRTDFRPGPNLYRKDEDDG
jgi:hypothetical protein